MREIGIFFGIFVPLTGVSTALAVITEGSILAVTALMWSVGLAAMATLRVVRRPLAELGWAIGGLRYHAIGYLLPAAYGLVAYLAAAALGLTRFFTDEGGTRLQASVGLPNAPWLLGIPVALGLHMTAGVVRSLVTALGEEIGWRGFLLPRLMSRWGFVRAALATGVLWAAWHLPGIFLGGYNAGGVRWAEVASFVVLAVSTSGAMAWLRVASGSLWPAALMHAAHNVFIQAIFDPLATRGPSPYTMVGEFGAALALFAALACAPFWIKGARMSAPPINAPTRPESSTATGRRQRISRI